MPLLRLPKVRAQRAHRRNFLDHVRKQILSGWGLLFFKRKGSLSIKEEAVVDDYVKAFAEHIQCDPELAQELYFKHKVTEALDNEQKASVRRELSADDLAGSPDLIWCRVRNLVQNHNICKFYLISQQMYQSTLVFCTHDLAPITQEIVAGKIFKQVHGVNNRDHRIQPRNIRQARARFITKIECGCYGKRL